MRLAFYLALVIITLVSYRYGYYTGYNQGSRDERFFTSTVIAPLCAALNGNDLDNFVKCIQGGMGNDN